MRTWALDYQIIMTAEVLTSHDNKRRQMRQSQGQKNDWVIESPKGGVTVHLSALGLETATHTSAISYSRPSQFVFMSILASYLHRCLFKLCLEMESLSTWNRYR